MSIKKEHTLQVSAIKDGTVIDHIPSSVLFKVIEILGLNNIKNQITFGTNLESSKLESKAIIKISDKFFADEEINKIALIAPQARLSIIRNYEVTEKKDVIVPKEIAGIAKCFNPRCITNHEPITPRFKVLQRETIALLCHYCEKITDNEDIQLL